MQGCRFNVHEFKEFTSGNKKIKPAVSDDWEVFTGGFRNSTDVLNLRSQKLGQTIYDISSDSFFKFMREENVTMHGNKIEGKFIIGMQRVLRKESDYLETMATVTERKSTMIDKGDLIVGNKYETVCGSHFVYAGARYVITQKQNPKKFVIELTKISKKHFKYAAKGWRGNGISDLGNQKVVKDLGPSEDSERMTSLLENHLNSAAFVSEERANPKLRLQWVPTKAGTYLMDPEGFVYSNEGSNCYPYYRLMIEDSEGNYTLGSLLASKYMRRKDTNSWRNEYEPDTNVLTWVQPMWEVV